jgi:hypothetical protein
LTTKIKFAYASRRRRNIGNCRVLNVGKVSMRSLIAEEDEKEERESE